MMRKSSLFGLAVTSSATSSADMYFGLELLDEAPMVRREERGIRTGQRL